MQADRSRPASADPSKGESLVLWRLRHGSGILCCFVAEWPAGFWLGVECASGELVVSETLPTLQSVVTRADDAKACFVREGWQEV